MVIPYRNRPAQLHNLSKWLSQHVKAHRAAAETGGSSTRWLVMVVEQDDDELFNKGFLVNAGLRLLASEEPDLLSDIHQAGQPDLGGGPHTCIVQHDVDFLPADTVDYTSCAWPRQLSSEIECAESVYNGPRPFTVPYPHSFGGVVSMRPAHWQAVNGFSNHYPGWGGEDDDLFQRVRQSGLLAQSLCDSWCEQNPTWNGSTWVSNGGPHAGWLSTVARPPTGAGRFFCQSHARGVGQSITSKLLPAATLAPHTAEETAAAAALEAVGQQPRSAVQGRGDLDAERDRGLSDADVYWTSKILDWMADCESVADNCSAYWQARDGLRSARYSVTELTRHSANDTSNPWQGLDVRWAKVRHAWGAGELRAEMREAFVFAKGFAPPAIIGPTFYQRLTRFLNTMKMVMLF